MQRLIPIALTILALCSCTRELLLSDEPATPADSKVAHAVSGRQTFAYRIAPVDCGTWIDESKQAQVRNEIDRISGGNLNMVIVGSFKFMPMYVIDYKDSPYPEASQMPTDQVASQKRALLANIEYAHQKGLKVLSGSYEHYCPYNFWRGRQDDLNPDGVFSDEWLLSVHQDDVFQSALNGSKDGVVPHQQWNNSVYKDFWVWSTKAMMDAIPSLDGFLNCYAESAWTYDIDKLKSGASESSSRDMIKTNADFVDYMNTLYDILLEKKGSADNFEIGIRDWYMDMNLLLQSKIPTSKVIVSVKYGGYDQPVVAVPQWGLELQNKGFDVVFDMSVYDAEYPHPVYWYDADFVRRIFDNLKENNVAGFAYQDYRSRSKNDEANPIRILTQKTVAAAIMGEPFTREDALDYLYEIYGAASHELLTSLECVTSAQADCIKLTPSWFWKGDGLTVGGLAYPRLWKYADNDESEGGRMDFIRQNVVGIPEYCNAVIADKKSSGYLAKAQAKWTEEGRITPLEAIANMEDMADKALLAMQEAVDRNGHGDKFGEIMASAVVHRQLVLRDVACMKGTIDFVLSGGEINGSSESVTSSRDKMKDTGIHKEKEAVDYFTEHVRRDLILRELCAMYTPRRPSMDDAKGYTYISKPCTALGYKFTVPELDTKELQSCIDLIKY